MSAGCRYLTPLSTAERTAACTATPWQSNIEPSTLTPPTSQVPAQPNGTTPHKLVCTAQASTYHSLDRAAPVSLRLLLY